MLAGAKGDRGLAGSNLGGRLGDGTTTDRHVPTPVLDNTVSSWLAISVGGGHTCGLAAGSRMAYCWGESLPRPALPWIQSSEAAGTGTPHATTTGIAGAEHDREVQAAINTADWVTATPLTGMYPHRCLIALSPAGSRSQPALSTRVAWLLATARTAMRTAGVSRCLAPP